MGLTDDTEDLHFSGTDKIQLRLLIGVNIGHYLMSKMMFKWDAYLDDLCVIREDLKYLQLFCISIPKYMVKGLKNLNHETFILNTFRNDFHLLVSFTKFH